MATFQLTPGIEGTLARMPGMVAVCRQAGEHIQGEAERISPRDPELPPDRRRHYADMFDTQAGLDGGKAHATVNNRHFIALFVEFGTSQTEPRAVLRRALDASRGRAL